MKKRRFEPEWVSLFAIFVAPPACGFNAVVAALIVGDKNVGLWEIFVGITLLALVLCFSLGFVSERILKIWHSGQTTKSRFLSTFCGLVAVFFLLTLLAPTLKRKEEYIFGAALLLPFVWSLLFFVFALFARPPKSWLPATKNELWIETEDENSAAP